MKCNTYKLKKYLNITKKMLKLNDWDIDIVWVNEDEMIQFFAEDEPIDKAKMSARDAVAATDISSYIQDNTSNLVHRYCRFVFKKGAFETKYDAVSAMVHEALHLFLAPIAPHDKDDRGMAFLEQIIITLEGHLAMLVWTHGTRATRRNQG